AVCPGCRHNILIPSAAECRRALAARANIIARSLSLQARTGSSATPSAKMDRPHPPRSGLLGKAPNAAAKGVAERAPSAVRGSTAFTPLPKAGHRPPPGAGRSDCLGMGALFLCLAALLCAWFPRLCGLVIPLAVAGALVGLSALVFVLYAAQK